MVYMSSMPLGGVGMAAVTGVHHVHMRRAMLGDQVRRAAFAVAHHEHVGVHGRQVGDGVQQALTLGRHCCLAMSRLITSADSRLAAISNVVRVRVLVLEEQVEHALATQQRHLFHLTVVDAERKVPAVSRMWVSDRRLRQAFDGQQVDQFAVAC